MINCEILSRKGKFTKKTCKSFLVVCDDFGYLVNDKSPTFIKTTFSIVFKENEKRKRILFKKGAICSWDLETLKIFV